jgi:hypothetical protein
MQPGETICMWPVRAAGASLAVVGLIRSLSRVSMTPGTSPHAGDAPASAPGPRAREPARRSGNVFMSPAPDRRANRRPERGGF